MIDTASDEINDHYAKLIDFALTNGYSIPATYNEMKKFADAEDIKLFEKVQKNKDASYYLKISVEAEIRAIETYEKFL
jgi:ferritin-like protein